MTLKEMQAECDKNYGICLKCKLNCIYDWYDVKSKNTWCLLATRKDYNRRYIKAKDEGKNQLAEEIAREYASIEQKYFNEERKEGKK